MVGKEDLICVLHTSVLYFTVLYCTVFPDRPSFHPEHLLSRHNKGDYENFDQISRFQPYLFFFLSSYPRYWVPYFERFFQFFFIFVVVVRFFGVFAKIRKKDRSLRSFKRPNGIIKLRTPFHTTHLVWGKDIISEMGSVGRSVSLHQDQDGDGVSQSHTCVVVSCVTFNFL
jgi:hypothetical protein